MPSIIPSERKFAIVCHYIMLLLIVIAVTVSHFLYKRDGGATLRSIFLLRDHHGFILDPIALFAFMSIFSFSFLRISITMKKQSVIHKIASVIAFCAVAYALVLYYSVGCTYFGIVGSAGPAHPITDGPSCFYFSIVTWTTLGYGDLSPSPGFRLIAASEAICGYIFMAMLMSLVSAVMLAPAATNVSQEGNSEGSVSSVEPVGSASREPS